jgi:hypothetical protein
MAKEISTRKRLISILAASPHTYRLARRLFQEALAERCGLHRTDVGSGERNVTFRSLEVLEPALGVSVPVLLTPRSHGNQ